MRLICIGTKSIYPRNGIIGKYLIYSGKIVFKILVVVVVVVQKPGKIWR